MNKVFEKLLEDFKRANLAARIRMAARFGFSSPEAYEAYLKQPLVKVVPTAGKKTRRRPPVAKPLAEAFTEATEAPTDMVIAFDTTGSMSSYIGAVRSHVQETIGNLFSNTPDLKLKIVAFGDYCDMVRPQDPKGPATVFGKAYQQTPLTNDKDSLIKFVRGADNTGGGDREEFYELVLQKILDETPWRTGSNRAILLIGDHEPHEVRYSCPPFVRDAQVNWRIEARKAALLKVRVDTMRIDSTVTWYQELSDLTEGTCMNFRSSAKTQKIVEASTYLNSKSMKGIGATKVLYRSALESGDSELLGAYKGLAKDRGINLDD